MVFTFPVVVAKNLIWTPRISQPSLCCQEGKDCTRISGLVVARATVPDKESLVEVYRFNALKCHVLIGFIHPV